MVNKTVPILKCYDSGILAMEMSTATYHCLSDEDIPSDVCQRYAQI
jgi:hypothetical protein